MQHGRLRSGYIRPLTSLRLMKRENHARPDIGVRDGPWPLQLGTARLLQGARVTRCPSGDSHLMRQRPQFEVFETFDHRRPSQRPRMDSAQVMRAPRGPEDVLLSLDPRLVFSGSLTRRSYVKLDLCQEVLSAFPRPSTLPPKL